MRKTQTISLCADAGSDVADHGVAARRKGAVVLSKAANGIPNRRCKLAQLHKPTPHCEGKDGVLLFRETIE